MNTLQNAVLEFVEGISVIKSYNMLGEKSKELSENSGCLNRKVFNLKKALCRGCSALVVFML